MDFAINRVDGNRKKHRGPLCYMQSSFHSHNSLLHFFRLSNVRSHNHAALRLSATMHSRVEPMNCSVNLHLNCIINHSHKLESATQPPNQEISSLAPLKPSSPSAQSHHAASTPRQPSSTSSHQLSSPTPYSQGPCEKISFPSHRELGT